MDLRDILQGQNGSLTLAQAREAGLSRPAIARLVASGDWERSLPRTYRTTDRSEHDRERVRRAGMWAGPTGTVVGTGAAAWWRLREAVPATVSVVRPPGCSGRAPAGVEVRRLVVPDEDRLVVDGITVTKRPRTILDAAIELGLVDGARLVDRALQQGNVAIETLHEALDRRGRAWGTPLARRLLATAEDGARSEAERRTAHALRGAGLGGFVLNDEIELPDVGRLVLDIAYRDRRLLIEVDGWAFHSDVDRFRRDRSRQNALVLAGWTVLRVTWYDIVGTPDAVVETVRRALAGA